MKQSLSTLQVAEILFKDQYAKWSPEAALALAKYYEQLEEELGQDISLDVASIRCDWSEYPSDESLIDEYNLSIEHIKDQTEVIELDDGSILVRVF